MYMLNMVIILIVMYCNVVTAIDKIPTYLLRFNKNLPAWQHIGTEKQPPRNPRSWCLAKNHKMKKVKDLINIAEWLRGDYRGGTHHPVYSCHCNDCTADRNNGCENPQRCALEAKSRLGRITPKLNPLCPPNQDDLIKTRPRRTHTQVPSNNSTESTAATEEDECYVTAGMFARRGLSSTAKTLRSLVGFRGSEY